MTNPTYGPTPQELDLAYIEAKSVSFFRFTLFCLPLHRDDVHVHTDLII
jgi:hypothetical protein